jgi:hypothetical protein
VRSCRVSIDGFVRDVETAPPSGSPSRRRRAASHEKVFRASA